MPKAPRARATFTNLRAASSSVTRHSSRLRGDVTSPLQSLPYYKPKKQKNVVNKENLVYEKVEKTQKIAQETEDGQVVHEQIEQPKSDNGRKALSTKFEQTPISTRSTRDQSVGGLSNFTTDTNGSNALNFLPQTSNILAAFNVMKNRDESELSYQSTPKKNISPKPESQSENLDQGDAMDNDAVQSEAEDRDLDAERAEAERKKLKAFEDWRVQVHTSESEDADEEEEAASVANGGEDDGNTDAGKYNAEGAEHEPIDHGSPDGEPSTPVRKGKQPRLTEAGSVILDEEDSVDDGDSFHGFDDDGDQHACNGCEGDNESGEDGEDGMNGGEASEGDNTFTMAILRRSPRKHGETVLTDLRSCLRQGQKFSDVMFGALMERGNKERAGRYRTHLKELLKDGRVTEVISRKEGGIEQITAAAAMTTDSDQSEVIDEPTTPKADNAKAASRKSGKSSAAAKQRLGRGPYVNGEVEDEDESPMKASGVKKIVARERKKLNTLDSESEGDIGVVKPRPSSYVPIPEYDVVDNHTKKQYTLQSRPKKKPSQPPAEKVHPRRSVEKLPQPPTPPPRPPAEKPPRKQIVVQSNRADEAMNQNHQLPSANHVLSDNGRKKRKNHAPEFDQAAKRKKLNHVMEKIQTAKRVARELMEAEDNDDMEADEEVDDVVDGNNLSGRKNKRRKGRNKKGKGAEQEAADVANPDKKSPLPHQIGFYSGLALKILRLALTFFHLFLLTKNGFPDVTEQYKQAKACYKAACRMILGLNYKERMPQYTKGMSKMIRDQTWQLRNKIKRFSEHIVDTHYGLHPPPEVYMKGVEGKYGAKIKNKRKEAFIRHRVLKLLDKETAPFLWGEIKKEDYPFAHPAIVELIGNLIFCPEHNDKPLAAVDLEAFAPIPPPLIAYAATGLNFGLEAYKSGKRTKSKNFTEKGNKYFYKTMQRNLRRMATSDSRPGDLETVQDMILEHGCILLEGHTTCDEERTCGPFIPSSDAEITDSEEENYESSSSSSDSE
ncbi:hypothetical protein SCHPADRAFT_896217 [Schizopora paradoxa]|uniref:DUF6532 domain-containing protein n=1 Tax=Schizopora paradoxa TaxID=27342 RepID=A0A0H2R142_9AGAM|nr:hypothetical protein SCHPADRAFT_896217 [Schizopora paradoxa]